MTLHNQHSSLSLNGLTLDVFLGWPEEERQQKQIVKLDVTVHFSQPIQACVSDELADTFAYDRLVALIQEQTAVKSFRLLEHLGYEIYQLIKQAVPTNTRVEIVVQKQPPIPALTGGASFRFGD
jgi:FolB domain-containing protein